MNELLARRLYSRVSWPVVGCSVHALRVQRCSSCADDPQLINVYAAPFLQKKIVLFLTYVLPNVTPGCSFPILLYPLHLLPSSPGWHSVSCTFVQNACASLVLRSGFNNSHTTGDYNVCPLLTTVRRCLLAWSAFHVLLVPATCQWEAAPVLLSRTRDCLQQAPTKSKIRDQECFLRVGIWLSW